MQLAQDLNRPFPVARTRNLVVKELPDETLIYDLDSDEAHCLNQTAALVWKNCDGTRSAEELANLLTNKLGVRVSENVVWLALDQLEQFKLLENSVSKPAPLNGMTRRHLMRTLGIAAAVSIPVITSIIVPTPAQAASCNSPTNRDPGCPCTADSQCGPPHFNCLGNHTCK